MGDVRDSIFDMRCLVDHILVGLYGCLEFKNPSEELYMPYCTGIVYSQK